MLFEFENECIELENVGLCARQFVVGSHVLRRQTMKVGFRIAVLGARVRFKVCEHLGYEHACIQTIV